MHIPRTDAVNAAAQQAHARVLARAASLEAVRLDGWESSLMGIGTSEDALTSLRYSGFFTLLTDPILEVMFMTEPFSERGVTTYPDVAFSEGVRYAGLAKPGDTSTTGKVKSYLDERWRVAEVATAGAIWGRLYGGAATWVVTDKNLEDLVEPLDPDEEILALRTIERPFCVPDMNPDTFDAAGEPTYFMLTPPQGRIHARVHISRLVLWPGDVTPQRRRIMRGFWDMSVLQRPYDVLKRNGLVAQSAMQLLKEASLGVLKISDLWASLVSNQSLTIAKRIRLFNQTRVQSRAIILDKDKEDFDRKNTTFAGVSDLTQSQRQEVAMAFRMPLTRLMGTSAQGLSGDSGGDASERQFQKDVSAYQRRVLEAPVHKLCTILLNGPDSPASSEGLAIQWPDLWAPSALEAAQIYSTTANADVALIDADVITAEQARSRFQADGYQQEIDISPAGAEDDETLDPETEAKAAAEQVAGTTSAGVPTTGTPEAQMNGAEIQALASIVSDVAAKKIPRDSAIAMISLAYSIPEDVATKIVGSAGAGFVTQEPLPAPGGAAPGAKPPAPGGAKKPTPDDKADAVDRADHVLKRGDKWVVTNEAETKVLGEHDTEAGAEAQLRAIEASKHGA